MPQSDPSTDGKGAERQKTDSVSQHATVAKSAEAITL